MNADLRDGYLGLNDYRWLWKAALAGVRVIAIIETDERQEVVSVHRSDSSVIAIESDATDYNQVYRDDTAEDFAKFAEDCEDLNLRWLMPTEHVTQEAICTAYSEANLEEWWSPEYEWRTAKDKAPESDEGKPGTAGAPAVESRVGRVVDIDGALTHRPGGQYSAGESVAVCVDLPSGFEPLVLRKITEWRES
jgi:hypothetical protein